MIVYFRNFYTFAQILTMKKLLLSGFAMLVFGLNSQITIVAADFGNDSDTVRISNSADLNVDFATTGADQLWDYSTLVAESQFLKNYQSLSDAGFFAEYIFGPGIPAYHGSYFIENTDIPIAQVSQFLPVSIESFNQVSKVGTDSVTSIGNIISIATQLIPVKSDTIETRYALPLEFGDTHFSRGYTYMDLSDVAGIIWLQHRARATEVDGWGVITTPFGTFNALRVRHQIQETDSVYVDFMGFAQWVQLPLPLSYEYEWWTSDQMDPILKITTTENQGNETVTAVEYRDIYRGLDAGITENNLHVALFPNPTNNTFTVRAEQSLTAISVYSTDGRLMKYIDCEGLTEATIDLSDLSQGTYLVEVKSGNSRQLSFVVKQ